MQRVLAIRTPDGHYLEFATLRAQTEDGELNIDLNEAVFAQVLTVPDPPHPIPVIASPQRQNGTITIDGAGGIESQENVKGLG